MFNLFVCYYFMDIRSVLIFFPELDIRMTLSKIHLSHVHKMFQCLRLMELNKVTHPHTPAEIFTEIFNIGDITLTYKLNF